MEIIKKIKLSDIFNFSIVSKRFYQITRPHKEFCKAIRISKHIVGFDEDYFDFLEDELQTLGKNICEKFKEKIVKNYFEFNLLDVSFKKIVFSLLPFKIYSHRFFGWRGSKTASKCDIFTKFFTDGNDLGTRIDREFILTKKSIEHLLISNLMEIVKTKSVVLNLYYVVDDCGKNDIMETENFGEIFLRLQIIRLEFMLFICKLT